MVLSHDRAFLGTTSGGGSSRAGTVFKVTTNGVLTSLVSFTESNGASLMGRLVLGCDGNSYGTTAGGGGSGFGTVFKVTDDGVLTSLRSFSLTNGGIRMPDLFKARTATSTARRSTVAVLGTMTVRGVGTVLKMTANSVLTSLFSFDGTNGLNPQAELVFGSDGNIYGTTSSGGAGGGGTIFRLALSPKFTDVARQLGGTIQLTGTGLPNEGYRPRASTEFSLPVASWTLLTSASFDSDGNFSYTDAGAATNSSHFYQLFVP